MAKNLYAITYTNSFSQTLIYNMSMGGSFQSCEFTDDVEHAKQALLYITKHPLKTLEGIVQNWQIIEISNEGKSI